jgi:transcriptional regulator with XRE-family HTH domain
MSIADALCGFTDKRIARASGAHPKTAARWRRGEAEPSGSAMLAMMRADDELLAALLHAAGRADDAKRARATALIEQAIREISR